MRNRFEIKLLDKETGESFIYDGDAYVLQTVRSSDDGNHTTSGGVGGQGGLLLVTSIDVLRQVLMSIFASDKAVVQDLNSSAYIDILNRTAYCLPFALEALKNE